MNTDEQLLRAFAGTQNQAAFAELVRRHAGAVYGSALRQTGSPDLAEEATQAVFILLARKAATLKPGVVLSGWLFRAAGFAANDLMKAERRRRHRETLAHAMNSQETTATPAEADSLWERVSPVLDACLHKLAEADRHALLLRFFENKSLAEVGRALGVAEDAARKRVSRALERLHALLVRQGAAMAPDELSPLLQGRVAAAMPAGLAASTVAAALGTSTQSNAGALSVAVAKQFLWMQCKGWALAGATLVAGGLGAGWAWQQWDSRPGQAAETRPLTDDYTAAGFPDATVVHELVRSLQQSLARGDRTQLAGLVGYPLRVNTPQGSLIVESEADLLRQFDHIFTHGVATIVLKSSGNRLYCDARGVMVGSGQAWITAQQDAQGEVVARVTALNVE